MDLGDGMAERAGVSIVSTRLPGLLVACTDGMTIWVDDRLTIRERRCAIFHEMIHIENGHTECQSISVERKVRAEAALRLVSWDAVWEHAPWANSVDELAEDLMVTRSVLIDWVNALPDEERAAMQKRFECAV